MLGISLALGVWRLGIWPATDKGPLTTDHQKASLRNSLITMVPTEGVESAQRFSAAFAYFWNHLQKQILHSQNQNVKNSRKRTKTNRSEQKLSAIVIKMIGIVHSRGSSQSFELSCANRLAALWGSGRLFSMSTVDVATFKARADELIAKAIAGEATVIEQDGKRAVLLLCEGSVPDFERDPETDRLLRQRAQSSGREPTAADWDALRAAVRRG